MSAVVIAGWGQVTQRKGASPPYLEPLDLMATAAREACRTAGVGAMDSIDALFVVRTQSRVLDDPCGELARRLGIKPRIQRQSGIGGQVPQQFVNQAAGLIARGEAETVLICGGETYYPRDANAVRGEQALIQGIPADYPDDDAIGSNALEQRHGLSLPIHGFPLFEVALWAQSGLDKAAWLARVGAMWARFSATAATHPNAWTRTPASAGEITTPSADNRLICFPYTKRMVSLVMADLAAAVIVTSARRAARMRDGAGRPAYFLGGGFAKDRQRFMIEKADYTRSPALATALARAQARAGLNAGDVECFDLYSCFPCAVSVARRELGISDADARPLTLTGGLGFFGGPGSNYALHGIASMAEAIASGRHASGMTTALGWFMHKYAVGLYGAQPHDADLREADREDDAHPEAGAPAVACAEEIGGRGRIETYTVIYDRAQSPQRALVYGRLEDGRRFVANADDDDISALTAENQVGRTVSLRTDKSINRARIVV